MSYHISSLDGAAGVVCKLSGGGGHGLAGVQHFLHGHQHLPFNLWIFSRDLEFFMTYCYISINSRNNNYKSQPIIIGK
jgi:hypothetical protein